MISFIRRWNKSTWKCSIDFFFFTNLTYSESFESKEKKQTITSTIILSLYSSD